MGRLSVLLLAIILVSSVYHPAQAAPQAPQAYPLHIGAIGDSITVGFNANNAFGDHPEYSWTTGAQVNSHAARIAAAAPGLQTSNVAVSGKKMNDLINQVTDLPLTVDYVTILLGANDACASSEATMTSVTNYHDQLAAGMAALSTRLPDARLYVVSIPNIFGLWDVLHTNSQARAVWSGFNICQSMLLNPTSMDAADVDRRARVRQRTLDYNAQLSAVCAEYIHCRYEGGFVSDQPFTAADVSGLDYFHPSVMGQEALAELTFDHTFHFTDTVAPVSTPTLAAGPTMFTVTLTATDNVGVSGIEYRLDGGPWMRYTAPLEVSLASTVTYRAVDVNGINEQDRIAVAPSNEAFAVYLPLLLR